MNRAAALMALMALPDEPCMGRRAFYYSLERHPQRNPDFIKRDLARAYTTWRVHDHLDISAISTVLRGNLLQVRRK